MYARALMLYAFLACIPTQTAFGQFGRFKLPNVRAIEKSIESAQIGIEVAKRSAEQDKLEEADRVRREQAEAEAKQNAETEAARRREQQEKQRLEELDDLKNLREATREMLKTVADLTLELSESNAAVKLARDELSAKQKELENEQNLFEMEKSKLELEKELQAAKKLHAEQSSWNWFLGFSVSVFTLCVSGFGAFIDHRHKSAEIERIRKELAQNTTPASDSKATSAVVV